MRVLVVSPPDPIVSYEEAVARLRLSGDEGERVDVESMIAAATSHIDGPDGWLGRAIGSQTLELRVAATEAAGSCVRLPYEPIRELVSVSHLDAANSPVDDAHDDFYLAGSNLYPESGTWVWSGCSLRAEAIRVRYIAGYEVVPEAIRAAILLMVGDLYNNRETTTATANVVQVPMSPTVERLLTPFRVFR